jgi:hypothetical protein
MLAHLCFTSSSSPGQAPSERPYRSQLGLPL